MTDDDSIQVDTSSPEVLVDVTDSQPSVLSAALLSATGGPGPKGDKGDTGDGFTLADNGLVVRRAGVYAAFALAVGLGLAITNADGQSGDPSIAIDATSSPTLAGITLNGGTVSATQPVKSVTQTWNNVATTFVAASTNIIDTASAGGSAIEQWSIGGSLRFAICKGVIFGTSADEIYGGIVVGPTTPIGIAHFYGSGAFYYDRLHVNGGSSAGAHFLLRTAAWDAVNLVPLAVPQDQTLACYNGQGFDGTTWIDATSGISIVAAENWSSTAHGTYMTFRTAKIGSNGSGSLALVINAAQQVGIGQNVLVGNIAAALHLFGTAGLQGPNLRFSRNDTSVSANDVIGTIEFAINDTQTVTNVISANIEVQAVSTITTDINPARMVFRTTPTTVAAVPVEAMRITETQALIIGGTTPNAAAILEVDSTSRGFLPPRMTQTQRDAISSPPPGLLIFNTTTSKYNMRGATAWEAFTSA